MKNKSNILLKVVHIIALLLVCSVGYGQKMISSSNAKSIICNPADFNFSVAQGADSQGCYYDVGFKQIWSYTPPMLCDVNQLPHGVIVEFTGATIISTQFLSGFSGNWWFLSATQTPTSVMNSSYVYWNKQPGGTCANPTNAIPSNQPKSVRIRVNPISNNVTVIVRNLIGGSWPAGWTTIAPGFWDCGQSFTFAPPQPLPQYYIGLDIAVCVNYYTALNITPTPPVGSTVEWYFNTNTNNNNCPSTLPPTGWTGPYQGSTFNTNYLINPYYCYVAVIKTGCFTYYSNIRRITVCNGPPNGSITSTPVPPYPALVNIGGEYHACQNWSGTLTLTPVPNTCTPIIRWKKRWQFYNGSSWGSWSPWTLLGTSLSLQTGLLTPGNGCKIRIEYIATMANICGPVPKSFVIVIDNFPNGGTINTLTALSVDVGIGTQIAPIVCKETRLSHQTVCGKPDHWESRMETAPCSGNYGTWTVIPNSNGTSTWWTNPYPLTQTTQYRVWVVNGACNLPTNGIYSQTITVNVIPDPTVSITTNTNLLCSGTQPTLTATANLPLQCIPNIPVSYKWWKDGTQIVGATSSTYNPTSPGNYYVTFSSNYCSKIVTSNVIPICYPKLQIIGPCCMCPATATTPAETITLTANMLYMVPCSSSCNITYLWSTGATTQQISTSQPGTYLVTATCGPCVQSTSFTVTLCPH